MNACNGDESNESMNKCMTCMYVCIYVCNLYVCIDVYTYVCMYISYAFDITSQLICC